MVTKNKIKEVLKKVLDPHTGQNIVDMGMIVEIKQYKEDPKKVEIKIQMPAVGCSGCMMMGIMLSDIDARLRKAGLKPKIDVV